MVLWLALRRDGEDVAIAKRLEGQRRTSSIVFWLLTAPGLAEETLVGDATHHAPAIAHDLAAAVRTHRADDGELKLRRPSHRPP